MCWFCDGKEKCEKLKDEIQGLQAIHTNLLSEIQEANAKYDYKVDELDKKIAELESSKESLLNAFKKCEANAQEIQWNCDKYKLFNTNLEIDLKAAKDEIKSIKEPVKAKEESLLGEAGMIEYTKKWWAKAPVERLNLSVRINNCFKVREIFTFEDLLAYSEEDLSKIVNFGAKSIGLVKKALVEYGLTLRNENHPMPLGEPQDPCIGNAKQMRDDYLKAHSDINKKLPTKKRGRPRKSKED
jgi:Bacterial RNA polymerase, alpha chain C terminal domain